MSIQKQSKCPRTEKAMGLRPLGLIPIDQPCELGYHCPVCKYDLVIDGNYDERLEWSEYNSFLWCHQCNRDYPSALCMPDIDRAIEIFLSTIEDINTIEDIKGS